MVKISAPFSTMGLYLTCLCPQCSTKTKPKKASC